MSTRKLYLSLAELSARSGVSAATLWRLKEARRIPFFQPGGPGTRLLFPADALERTEPPEEGTGAALSGPTPKWMGGGWPTNQGAPAASSDDGGAAMQRRRRKALPA